MWKWYQECWMCGGDKGNSYASSKPRHRIAHQPPLLPPPLLPFTLPMLCHTLLVGRVLLSEGPPTIPTNRVQERGTVGIQSRSQQRPPRRPHHPRGARALRHTALELVCDCDCDGDGDGGGGEVGSVGSPDWWAIGGHRARFSVWCRSSQSD